MAYRIAERMARKCPILEYGIQRLDTRKTWKDIVQNAKTLAPLELFALQNAHPSKWKYEMEMLEHVMAM